MAAEAPSRTAPVIAVERVDRGFRSGDSVLQAVREVSFTAIAGHVTGLIGPDGAGKTTLMRLVAGLLLPDAGTVRVLGRDMRREPLAAQAEIGYMPQRFGLYEDLTVQENLDLYADLHSVPMAERPQRYAELTAMTGLGPFGDRLAGRLSGGMKQKLGLACTLVDPPRLLLLDEPTVGVDPVSRRELWEIVYRLVHERGTSVLLSTAYMDEAERCDEVILLSGGRVFGQGTPGDFSGPLRGRVFLASAPRDRRRIRREAAALPGVIDATLQGESVRVVTRAAGRAPAAPGTDVVFHPAAPRFEDGFVALLRPDGDGNRSLETTRRSVPTGAAASGGDARLIEVDGLTRRFGDFYAVRDLSFEVRRGEVFGLLGANGAGKSTTFRMLCGLLPASGGSARVAGVDLRRGRARARARIGYVAQRFALYGALSVAQNLAFFASAYNLTGRRRRERIDWVLEQFELGPYRDRESGTLPLGFKQRLALGAALLHEPDILFLDEPTSGVDPLARREFWARINTLAEQGVTVMVTTHFMEEADYCDRLAIMVSGGLLALGSPTEIKRRALGAADAGSMEDAFIALVEDRPR
ncbi:MAG TPA: ATP-binding cassette domain-containing protein [Gammaproteobacteria bacterium]|nr:ATP-binding cassette domain-containing protein [Gammaproteobacteria bacterium]